MGNPLTWQCLFIRIVFEALQFATLSTVLLISVERLVASKKASLYKKLYTRKKVLVEICGIRLVSIAFACTVDNFFLNQIAK